MINLFETIFEEINNHRVATNHEENILKDIEKNSLLLKRCLSKKEKKLLLRIIDNKDLLLEDTAIRNFIIGFKLGTRFGTELSKE